MVSAVTPGPKDMAQPLAGRACCMSSLENEKYRWRGHVAVIQQNVARVGEASGAQLQPLLDGVENGAASGMNRPKIDGVNGRRPA